MKVTYLDHIVLKITRHSFPHGREFSVTSSLKISRAWYESWNIFLWLRKLVILLPLLVDKEANKDFKRKTQL